MQSREGNLLPRTGWLQQECLHSWKTAQSCGIHAWAWADLGSDLSLHGHLRRERCSTHQQCARHPVLCVLSMISHTCTNLNSCPWIRRASPNTSFTVCFPSLLSVLPSALEANSCSSFLCSFLCTTEFLKSQWEKDSTFLPVIPCPCSPGSVSSPHLPYILF